MEKQPIKATAQEVNDLRRMFRYFREQEQKNATGLPDGEEPPVQSMGALICTVMEGGVPAATDADTPGKGNVRIRKLWITPSGIGSTDRLVVDAAEYTNYDPDVVKQVAYNIGGSDYAEGDQVICMPLAHGGLVILSAEGTAGQLITFSIVSSDPSIRRALVSIRQRSFQGPTYGSFLDDSTVYVYDTNGCSLNKPNVELTGRVGWAALQYVNAEALAIHFPEYGTGTGTGTGTHAPPVMYWNVITVCCLESICTS